MDAVDAERRNPGGLRQTCASLRRTLDGARARRVFAAGRARHEALEGLASPEWLLDRLAEGAASPEVRSEIVRAVVVEARGRPGACWTPLLVVAFEPALARLVGCIRPRGGLSREDLEGTVLLAFHEAVHTFSNIHACESPIATLVRNTRRRVFRRLAKEDRHARVVTAGGVDHEATAQRVRSERPSPEDALLRRAPVARVREPALRERLRARFPTQDPDVLVALLRAGLEGPGLLAWVRAREPGLDGNALLAAYQRWRRRRRTVLDALRAELADVAPVELG